ncbi:MAG TPA: ATP-binding protein [Chloroflexota bacterium]
MSTLPTTSDGESQSLEQFKALYRAELERQKHVQRDERYRDVRQDYRVWLALPPCWTSAVANGIQLFRSDVETTDALNRLSHMGLLTRTSPGVGSGVNDPVYVVATSVRSELLEQETAPAAELRTQTAELAQHILKIGRDSHVRVPISNWRWAKLAEHATDTQRLVDTFDRYITRAFEDRAAFQLLNWIEAARPLARLLARDADPALELALHRASRRLELLHRRAYDEEQLQHFLERQDQVDVFDAWMRGGRDGPWALHFIGPGGVGKTMLVRHIAVNLANRYGAATARIDFDYINPDYPRLAPGLLLWALAQELRAFDQTRLGRVNTLFDDGDANLDQLHQRLRSDHRSLPSARATDDPQFRIALGYYIEAFRTLERPIILVIDTCEELAKLTPAGTLAPSVEETFRILRGLRMGPEALDDDESLSVGPHANGLPNLRVVFSGRRPLASSGFAWSWPGVPELPSRPYLRLHRIEAFTLNEAHRFLTTVTHTRPELVDAIVTRTSRDAAGCNPYELRMYADWAADEPPPTQEDILESTNDRYVELRIIRRLGDTPLHQLLPFIALVGHIDQPLLRAATGLDEASAAHLFAELGRQEWVTQRYTSTTGDHTQTVLDVQNGVRAQLADYYRHRSITMEPARGRAADHLETHTLHTDLSTLDWATIEVAVRCLEADPDPTRVHAWWNKLEQLMLRERDFQWVLDVTGNLLAIDSSSRVRPAVAATHASALLHAAPTKRAELEGIWGEIAETASNVRVPEIASALMLRSAAGMVVARAATTDLSIADTRALWDAMGTAVTSDSLDVQLAAALVAATEAVIERAEQVARNDRQQASDLLGLPLGALQLERLVQVVSPDGARSLHAFAHSLVARTYVIAGDLAAANEHFKRSLENLPQALGQGSHEIFSDWTAPENLRARLALEFVRAMYPAMYSPSGALEALGNPDLPRQISVDADRFASAIIRLRLAEGPLPSEVLAPVGWFDPRTRTLHFHLQGVTPGPAVCNAHRAIPPLFASAAELVASNGQVDSALRQLRHIVAQVEQFDLESVRNADRVLVRIMRRMRLRDVGEAGGVSLLGSPELEDRMELLALDGLDAEKSPVRGAQSAPTPEYSSSAAWLHARWRTRFARSGSRREQALLWLLAFVGPGLPKSSADPSVDFDEASLRLDMVEGHLLNQQSEKTLEHHMGIEVVDPAAWWEAHSSEPEAALRLWIRTLVLIDGAPPMPENNSPLIRRLGVRRAAAIALDEGELLALRLPHQACTLVGHATRLSKVTGDEVTTIIAGTELTVLRCRPPSDKRKLRSCVETIRAAYYRFASHQPPEDALPGWQVLRELAKKPSAWQLDSLNPYGWRPVLARIMACLVRQHALVEGADPGLESAAQSATVSAFGTVVGKTVALPADFVEWAEQASARHEREPRSRFKTALTVAAKSLAVILALIVAIVVVVKVLSNFEADLSSPGLQPGNDPNPGNVTNNVWLGLVAFGITAPVLVVGSWFVARAALRWAWLRRGPRGRRRGAFRWTVLLLGLLATAALVQTLVFVVDVSLPGPHANPFFGPTERALWYWLFLGAPAFILVAWIEAVLATRAWLASRSSVVLQVASAEALALQRAVPADMAKLNLVLEQSRRVPLLRFLPPIVTRIRQEARLPHPTVPYVELARELPPGIVRSFQHLDASLGARSLAVRLELDDDSHGPCWEAAILNFGKPAQGSVREPALHVHRCAPRRFHTAAPVVDLSAPVHVVVWTENRIAAAIAQRAWPPPFKPFVSGTSQIAWVNQEVGRVRALHLVGNALETSAGFRCRLAQELVVETQVANARGTSLVDYQPDDTGLSSTLVRPSDVPRIFPDLAVCIVQGEPDKLSATRLDADRRAAASARFFAARLFRQGVPAVIVIPPLPAGLAQSVATQVASTLASSPDWGVSTFLSAVSKARTTILNSAVDPARDAERTREQALDVCVYIMERHDTLG